MRKKVISPYLKRNFLKRTKLSPKREREIGERGLLLYETLVFIEKYVLLKEMGETTESLCEMFPKRYLDDDFFSDTDKAELHRKLSRLDQMLRISDVRDVKGNPLYWKLISEAGSYLSSLLDFFKIPYRVEKKKLGVSSYLYFKTKDWVGSQSLPPEARLEISKFVYEESRRSGIADVEREEVLYTLRNTKLPEIESDEWSEREKDNLRLSGVLSEAKDSEVFFSKHKWALDTPNFLPDSVAQEIDTVDEVSVNIFTIGNSLTSLDSCIYRDKSGNPIHIRNELITKGKCGGLGVGTQVVFGQIISALKVPSIKGISLLAEVYKEEFVGGKVWPKFGFDGVVSYNVVAKEPDILNYLERTGRPSNDDLSPVKVSQILSAIDGSGNNIGVSWWDKNAVSFEAMFDLDPNSLSMKVFMSYFRKKLSQYDMSAEDFLSINIPLTLSEPECFLYVILENEDRISQLLPDLLSNFDNFKPDEKEKILKKLDREGLSSLALILSGKRGSVKDPIAEEIWGEIGREKLRQVNVQKAVALLKR